MFSFKFEDRTINIHYWGGPSPVPEMKLSVSGHGLTFWLITKDDGKIKARKHILTDIRYFPGLTEFLENNKNIEKNLVLTSQ